MKKSQADKALANLASSGKVVCKEFGKTKIYFASQEELPTLSEDEIKDKMAQIEGIKSECQVKGAAVSVLLQGMFESYLPGKVFRSLQRQDVSDLSMLLQIIINTNPGVL